MRKSRAIIALIAALFVGVISTKLEAYEAGAARAQALPGLAIGPGASNPPPGIYAIEAFATYQAVLTGPGAPHPNGGNTEARVAGVATGILIVPGWEFLGATYNATILVPFLMQDFSAPLNIVQRAMNNVFFVPAEFSRKFGDSGFYAKTSVGIYAPTGTIQGANGLGNIGQPWWTFQPRIVLSYLKDGYNLTANVFEEIRTRNTFTDYRSGNILHAEFTATKTIDRWTVGPVGYFLGQVTSDQSSAYYNNQINLVGYRAWAAGAFLKYDFGPVSLSVWALRELSVKAWGGMTKGPGIDTSIAPIGTLAYMTLTFQLYDLSDRKETPALPRITK